VAVPSTPNWVDGELITETKLDQINEPINFLLGRPLAQLDRSTNQTIANNTHTAIQWNSETFDSVNGHNSVTNNSRYTAAYDGIYLLMTSIPIANTSDAYKLEVYFKRSDGVEYNGSAQHKTSSDTTPVISSSRLMQLTVGSYVEVWFWHSKGSNATVDASFHGGPKFDIIWMSA